MAALATRCEPTGGRDRATGRPHLLCRTPSSYTDTDQSTRQTVELMVSYIKDALADPLLRDLAAQIRQKWALGNQTQTATAWAVFWFLKHQMRFVPDEISVFARFGERDAIDYLVAPHLAIRSKPLQGDCDEFTMLSCALLLLNGMDCEIVTVACSRSRPGEWSHVYCRAILPDGRHMPIDATPAGLWPGWEVPAYDVQRKQIWGMDGSAIPDAGSARVGMGLQGYVRRGLGQDDTSTADLAAGLSLDTPTISTLTAPTVIMNSDGSSTVIDSSGNSTTISAANTLQAANATGSSSSSSSGFNINTLLSSIFGGAAKVGQTAVLPAGYSLSASGAVVPTSSLTLGGLNLSAILLYGGALMAVIVVLDLMKQK
jgi:hypothetical protein